MSKDSASPSPKKSKKPFSLEDEDAQVAIPSTAPQVNLLAGSGVHKVDTFKKGEKRAIEIEGYTLLKVAGRGNQAVVFKAQDQKSNQIVAIKILNPNIATDTRFERFFKEAKLLTEFDHPNIAKGYAFGESNGYYYFVMEYLKGVTAREFVEQQGKMSNAQLFLMAEQITYALIYANSIKLIHRDIKPDNMMIVGDFKGIKLCDLGLAKALEGDKNLTQAGQIVGTPNYIPPEIALGDPPDIRSDIYALGASLYYMATGTTPFFGETAAEVMRKHIYEALVPPLKHNPSLDPHLSELLENMMDKNPSERPQTPDILLKKIKAVQDGHSSRNLTNFEENPLYENISLVEDSLKTTPKNTPKNTSKTSQKTPQKAEKEKPVPASKPFNLEDLLDTSNLEDSSFLKKNLQQTSVPSTKPSKSTSSSKALSSPPKTLEKNSDSLLSEDLIRETKKVKAPPLSVSPQTAPQKTSPPPLDLDDFKDTDDLVQKLKSTSKKPSSDPPKTTSKTTTKTASSKASTPQTPQTPQKSPPKKSENSFDFDKEEELFGDLDIEKITAKKKTVASEEDEESTGKKKKAPKSAEKELDEFQNQMDNLQVKIFDDEFKCLKCQGTFSKTRFTCPHCYQKYCVYCRKRLNKSPIECESCGRLQPEGVRLAQAEIEEEEFPAWGWATIALVAVSLVGYFIYIRL
jgi:serine/threonine protein kinase